MHCANSCAAAPRPVSTHTGASIITRACACQAMHCSACARASDESGGSQSGGLFTPRFLSAKRRGCESQEQTAAACRCACSFKLSAAVARFQTGTNLREQINSKTIIALPCASPPRHAVLARQCHKVGACDTNATYQRKSRACCATMSTHQQIVGPIQVSHSCWAFHSPHDNIIQVRLRLARTQKPQTNQEAKSIFPATTFKHCPK